MIAPDDTQLAMEGSEERRRFIDNTLSQIDAQYLLHLIRYNHILRQRTAFLKMAAENSRPFEEELLAAYDRQMEEPAVYIFERRLDFTGHFLPLFQQHYTAISGGQEQVSCAFQSQLTERPFPELLLANREKDRLLQRTGAGISTATTWNS